MFLQKYAEKFYKDSYLMVLLAFAFFYRLYYFVKTMNQPLWWDEAEYMNLAIFGFGEGWPRALVFPILERFILFLGGGETAVKFLLAFLPSILFVAVVYFLVKDMFNRNIAVISGFLATVFWLHIFYATRLLTDVLAMFLSYLAIYLFWKGYTTSKNKFFITSAFCLGLAFLTRFPTALFGFAIFLFWLVSKKHKLFLSKNFYVFSGSIFILVLPFLIWNYIKFDSIFYFLKGSHVFTESVSSRALPFAWYVFDFFPHYLGKVYLILFLIGALFFYDIFLGFDLISKNKKLAAKFLLFAIFITHVIYFVFIERGAEDRWFMPMIVFSFVSIALFLSSISFVFDKIKEKFLQESKFSKYVTYASLIVVVLLLLAGLPYQFQSANLLVDSKVHTYEEFKQAGLFLKDIVKEDEAIFSNTDTQELRYYSKTDVSGFDTEEMDARFERGSISYVIFSLYPGSNEDHKIYVEEKINDGDLELIKTYTNYYNSIPSVYVFKTKK